MTPSVNQGEGGNQLQRSDSSAEDYKTLLMGASSWYLQTHHLPTVFDFRSPL